MSLDEGIIDKKDMNTETTYLLCPDRKCRLFFDTSRYIPCESDCPHKDQLVKIIQCFGCGEPIELPGDHFFFCRVEHNCPDGRGIMNLHQRMTGKYHLIYERPR